MPYFSLKYCFFTAAGSALLRFILAERKTLWSIGPFLKEYIHCSQQTTLPSCFCILTNDDTISFVAATSSAQAILYLKADILINILPNSDTWIWITWIQIPTCPLSNIKRSEQTLVYDRLDTLSDSVSSKAWWEPVCTMWALNPFLQWFRPIDALQCRVIMDFSKWHLKRKQSSQKKVNNKNHLKLHREEINEQTTEGNPILWGFNSNYYRFVALTSHFTSISKCIFATDNYTMIIVKIPHIVNSCGSLQGKQ